MHSKHWVLLLVMLLSIGTSKADSIHGVDVSQYNGTINWPQVSGQGVRFAWIRSTLGVGIDDHMYSSNTSGAHSAGIVTGAYHFCYPVYTGGSNTAVAEAQWFVSRAGAQIGSGYLPPALDVENDNGENPVISSMTTAALSEWVLAWCREVQRLTGVKPIVYMSSNFASGEVDGRVAAEFPLWIANYGVNDGVLDLTRAVGTGSWPAWKFWQYTSRGILSGNGSTYIDRNVFAGDEAAFQSFISTGDTPLTDATDAMLALNRTTPQVMEDILNPNASTTHFEARIMVRRILENFLGTTLTPLQLSAISSAAPFDDPAIKPDPVLRQEVFKMLTGALEIIHGYVRPSVSPPLLADLPASGWERDGILAAFAWQITDADDISTIGLIEPTATVSRARFAKWAVHMMDVLLNPPVDAATPDMLALSTTVPVVMSDLSNPRRYTTHYEARIMVKKTLELALGRSLTEPELLNISVVVPFDDAAAGSGPVTRREVFKMLLGGLEGIATRSRPGESGIALEDLPPTGWQRDTIMGCNAWSIFDGVDTPSSEIYESARVSRYKFAKWNRKFLSLLDTATPESFNLWVTDAGLIGANAVATADPDQDGLNNAVEMVLGGNPSTGMNVALAPTVERIVNPDGTVPAGDYLLFTYRRSDSSVASGVMSGVEYDTDMGGVWTQTMNGANGVRIVENNDSFGAGVDRVQVYIPHSSKQKIFARLKVVIP